MKAPAITHSLLDRGPYQNKVSCPDLITDTQLTNITLNRLEVNQSIPRCESPVSPRFFGEFDMLTFTARHFEKKTFVPSSTQLTRKPTPENLPKAALKPLGMKHLGRC